MAYINIHIPACTLFLPTLSLTLHLRPISHLLCSLSFLSHTHTDRDTGVLHGTQRPSCQWESVLWSKSEYFVSSRSDAQPVGSLNQQLTASWLLPLWLWRLHLFTFSVCLQVKFNPRSTAALQNTGSEYWEVSLIVLHGVYCSEVAVFLLHRHPHLSPHVGGQVSCLYRANMSNICLRFRL